MVQQIGQHEQYLQQQGDIIIQKSNHICSYAYIDMFLNMDKYI
jgi:hypothetical protein